MPLSKVPRFCCIGAALFFNHSFYQGCVCFALNVSMASCTEQREERTLETPQYCCCVCIFLPLLHALRAAAASLLSGQHKALSDLAGHVWLLGGGSVLYGYVALNLLTQNKASECELSRSRQPATLKSKK